MCLKITSTKKRNCRKAYKIVATRNWDNGVFSVYQNYQFVHLRAWQFESRKTYLTGTEELCKSIDDGYHLCPNLKSAKKTLNNLPGIPNERDGYQIWECEVRPENFVASGTFKLENYNNSKSKNPQADSVVYTTFRFVRKIKKDN